MGQQIKIERSLEFIGDANEATNVKGYWNPEKVWASWDFRGKAMDNTNDFTSTVDAGGTIAVGTGGCLISLDTTDDDVGMLACGAVRWYPAKNPVMEARISVDVITTVAINVGWTDANTEVSPAIPFAIAVATITDTCTDGAMFCFDIDQTTDRWYIVNTKNNTQAGTLLGAAYVPVAATPVTLRVAIDSLGNATYYYDGVMVGYKALAVTPTVPLVPAVVLANRGSAAHVLTVNYVRAWCDM